MANKDGLQGLSGPDEALAGRGFEDSARMMAEFEAEMARLREQLVFTGREVGTLSNGIGTGLRRAFSGLVLDGMKLSDALKGIGRSMTESVFSVAMRPIEQALAGALSQGITGVMAGALPFANGGAFLQGRVMPFARGGVVSQPTYFPMRGATGLMGEAGPEAIMPLRRGADGRLGVAAASGGGRPVQVTVNITTPDVTGFQRSQSQIAAQLGRIMARGERNS